MAFCLPGDIPDCEAWRWTRWTTPLAASACTMAEIPHTTIRDLFEERPRLAEVLWRETLIDAAISEVAREHAPPVRCGLYRSHNLRIRGSHGSHRSVGRSEPANSPLTQTDLGDAAALPFTLIVLCASSRGRLRDRLLEPPHHS